MKKTRCFVRIIILFSIVIFFICCDLSLEPNSIELVDNPVELKWIQHDREGLWFNSRYKDLFDAGIECDQILLYLDDRYFTHSIGDTIYLQEMRDYLYDNWTWCQEGN